MKNPLVADPTTLSIITTYKCTSACENCCFQSNPQRKEQLSVTEIIEYITLAVNDFNSIKILVLTGGECFIYGKKLAEIIRHAVSLGLMTRVVTNGFWASKKVNAERIIERLVDAGLNEINFSTGDDHLKYVSIDTIKNGVLASLKYNLKPLVNVESNNNRVFSSKYLVEDSDLKEFIDNGDLTILNGLWIPLRTSSSHMHISESLDKDLIMSYPNKRCTNIFNTITIDPTHRMLACCGITNKYIKYLDSGCTKTRPIKELYNKQFSDFLKIWLSVEGPHKIMKFISHYIEIEDPHYIEQHACQVCEKLFNKKEYLNILQKEYKNVYSSILMNDPEASLEVSVSRTMKVVRRAASYISSHSLDLKHKPLSHLDYHITQQYLHNIHLSKNYRPIVVS